MSNTKKNLLKDRPINFEYIEQLKQNNISLIGIKEVNSILNYPLIKGNAISINSNTIKKASQDGRFPPPCSINARKIMTWSLNDIIDIINKFKTINDENQNE